MYGNEQVFIIEIMCVFVVVAYGKYCQQIDGRKVVYKRNETLGYIISLVLILINCWIVNAFFHINDTSQRYRLLGSIFGKTERYFEFKAN